MAYIKILRDRNPLSLEVYIFSGRECDDPMELNGCMEGFVTTQFIGTQKHFGEEDFNAIHILQSFDPTDSTKLAPEEYTKLGRRLVEEYFPGHEFAVVTHTDEKHLHNHIMLNPVNSETGKRINNKKHILYDLRAKSDEICIERGLSIIEAQSQKTWEKTPDSVREMKRKGGFSWVLDLKEKADFARTLATSFDEYAGILNQFGIQVRVENKNIGYFYPGRKQKRGDTYGLGQKYTKSGLVEQFKENYLTFQKAGLKSTPIEKINFSDHWKFHRGVDKYIVPEYRYKDLVIPKELISSIQGLDLKEYGERLGHKFFVDAEGDTRLLGKDHLVIKDNGWFNEKTKAQGGTLEFINYCHNESWLETLKRFDSTKKVSRVREVIGEKTPSFKAFYAPQTFREPKIDKKINIEGIIFESSRVLATLSKGSRVKGYASGKFKFHSQEFPNSSLTAYRQSGVWLTRHSKGINGSFFSSIKSTKDPLVIFEDPIAFLSAGKLLDRILNERKPVNIVVPLKPLEDFLKERKDFVKKYPKVRLVHSKEKFLWGLEGSERSISDEQRSEWEKALGIKYASIEELIKELILGRSL